jgi:cytochrome P450
VLSMLIAAADEETGQQLSDHELVDEMVTLVIAGFETTAVLLAWTWLLLADHPEVDRWVRQEWQALDPDQPMTAATVAHLPRTRAVIAESLRVRPPAWTLDRRAHPRP